MTIPTESPFLSVVIPAYNEESGIALCLKTLQESLEEAGLNSYEIIVSDDASTDATAQIAESLGARVVQSGLRNIGATRNVGASVASGEYLLFVDSDTQVPPETAATLKTALEEGALGGGAAIRWSEPVPWHARLPLWIWNRISRTFKLPAGSFLFARRSVFEKVGGFDPKYFAGEEIALGRALKREGTLKILKEPVLTSPRKVHLFTVGEMLVFFVRWIKAPRKTLQDRRNLDYWYARRD